MIVSNSSSPGIDPGAKRRQLDTIKPRAGMWNKRQAEMGIDVGITVPREMLDGGDHAALGQSTYVSRR